MTAPNTPNAETLTDEQAAIFSAAELAINQLEQHLIADDGDIRDYLRDINAQLRQFPELLYLLSKEQRSAVYRGLIKTSGIEIVKAKAKKKGQQHILDDGKSVLDLLGD